MNEEAKKKAMEGMTDLLLEFDSQFGSNFIDEFHAMMGRMSGYMQDWYVFQGSKIKTEGYEFEQKNNKKNKSKRGS